MGMEDKKPGRGLALILGGEDDESEDDESDGVTAARAFAKAQAKGDHKAMFCAFCCMQKASDSEPEEEDDEDESDEGDEPKEELDFG